MGGRLRFEDGCRGVNLAYIWKNCLGFDRTDRRCPLRFWHEHLSGLSGEDCGRDKIAGEGNKRVCYVKSTILTKHPRDGSRQIYKCLEPSGPVRARDGTLCP